MCGVWMIRCLQAGCAPVDRYVLHRRVIRWRGFHRERAWKLLCEWRRKTKRAAFCCVCMTKYWTQSGRRNSYTKLLFSFCSKCRFYFYVANLNSYLLLKFYYNQMLIMTFSHNFVTDTVQAEDVLMFPHQIKWFFLFQCNFLSFFFQLERHWVDGLWLYWPQSIVH